MIQIGEFPQESDKPSVFFYQCAESLGRTEQGIELFPSRILDYAVRDVVSVIDRMLKHLVAKSA